MHFINWPSCKGGINQFACKILARSQPSYHFQHKFCNSLHLERECRSHLRNLHKICSATPPTSHFSCVRPSHEIPWSALNFISRTFLDLRQFFSLTIPLTFFEIMNDLIFSHKLWMKYCKQLHKLVLSVLLKALTK